MIVNSGFTRVLQYPDGVQSNKDELDCSKSREIVERTGQKSAKAQTPPAEGRALSERC